MAVSLGASLADTHHTLILFILCVCTYMWWHMHTDVHVEVRAQLVGTNSLLHVHPRDGTQAVRFGGRSLYTLS